MADTPLIETVDLHRRFRVSQGSFRPKATLHAVNGVNLRVRRGETLGVVGESGCGKSTLAEILLGLLTPSEGTVLFDGREVRDIPRADFAHRVQPIFQDPFSSLNPRKTVLDIVRMPLAVHGIGTLSEQDRQAREMMQRVGLPARFADRYPKELSGGQRQRVAIARALVMRPEVVICDEPTSALDASVQSQILNLLMELKADFNLTYVFIVHDLAVAEYFCDRLAVLYLGAVMELTDRDRLFREPLHPYTDALLSAVPVPDPTVEREREHRVITAGPYRWVRHPSYLGLSVGAAASAFALGSYWSLLPVVAFVLLYARRAEMEDRVLAAELPGYARYAGRVRYRLAPWLW